MKKQYSEIFYTGWFNDEPIKLDTTIYQLCPSCDGTGETDWEFPVRCLTCCGDGYVTKKDKSILEKKEELEQLEKQFTYENNLMIPDNQHLISNLIKKIHNLKKDIENDSN